MITSIDVDGRRIMIYPNWVGPEFFQTMRIPLLRGRYFRAGEKNVVILSESLARKRWPTEDPIGKQWKDGKDIVVGVVGNTRAMELNNTDATEIYYPPTADVSSRNVRPGQSGRRSKHSYAQRSSRLPAASTPGSFQPSPRSPPASARMLSQVEQIATIVSLLGSIAIFLAVVGLLGLVSFAVSQEPKKLRSGSRSEPIAPRLSPAVLRRFAWPVLLGLIAGVAITAGLSQILRRVLYGISGLDPISYAGAMALLIAILAAAALLPIRRAFALDIARILHSE